MLDLRQLRSDPDAARTALRRRLDPKVLEALDDVLRLDEQRRALQTDVDAARAQKNREAEEIGRLKRAGEDASAAMAAAADGRARLAEGEGGLGDVSGRAQQR